MTNTIILGDNLEKSKQYVKEESVDLIFTDPLWKTNKSWLASDDLGTIGYYEDHFESLESYLYFLKTRMSHFYTLLKPGGHIILHVDSDFSAYIKTLVMDSVFGRTSYKNTIVWCFHRWAATTKNKLNKLHHDLLWYTKKPLENCTYNEIRVELDKPRKRNLVGRDRKALRDKDGNVQNKEQVDRPIGDVWDDILPVPNKGGERIDYPTQKPLGLAERAIKMLTNEGDLIMEPFMGSGTTLLAAANLNRRFIGFDNEQAAFDKTYTRLVNNGIAFRSINGKAINVKSPDQMSPYEYQEFIVNALGGVLGPRGADGGIDGVIESTLTGIAVSKSKTNRQKIAQFATDLDARGLKNGIFVSPLPASREARSEVLRLKLAGKVFIDLKTDKDIIKQEEPKVLLIAEGNVIRAKTSGFLYPIVNYTWSTNDNEIQTTLFEKKKRVIDKNDRTGMKDFSGYFRPGETVQIKCLATASDGQRIKAEIFHTF